MAEIKSTLDIIMERTKHLTLTESEKEDVKHEERNKTVKGWIQKYLDNIITLNILKGDLKAVDKKNQTEFKELIKCEVLQRIEPDTDNSKLFILLEDISGTKKSPIEKIISKFKDKVLREKNSKNKKLLKQLAPQGISGPAVISNINKDPEWVSFYQKAKYDFREELKLIQDN